MNSFFSVNLNLYRSFYYVAKYGGFSKASSFALVSQPTLSMNIKTLEDTLNVKLFHRINNNIILTAEGKDLFAKLEEIINIFDNPLADEELNIGCTRIIADNFLDKIVSKFKENNKNIRLSFSFADSMELFQLLKKDEIDIIISRYPIFYKFDKSICLEKIIDIENVFACSKKFYLENKELIESDDYVYPMILPNNSSKRRLAEKYLLDKNINYKVEIELPNSILLKKLINDGLGIGYVNKEFIKTELMDGSIVAIDKFKNIPSDNITIIYNTKRKNKKLEQFIKILKNDIKKTNS